jgi:endonuclease-3
MKKNERYQFVLEYFEKQMPIAETELNFENTYQLLVAVILSAQCTDKRINLVTPSLFSRFPDLKEMSQAEFDTVFELIRSISYPNNKAKHLIGMAQMVMQDFNGVIPMTVEELIKLPGVGRKTANVITSVIDHQPNMAVDTHVFRVSARIGLTTNAKTTLSAEKQLIKNIPKSKIHIAHHWLILHGRYCCIARKPKCGECIVADVCNWKDRFEFGATKPIKLKEIH